MISFQAYHITHHIFSIFLLHAVG